MPLSPPLAAFLQPPPLQRMSPPPAMGLEAVKLQALRMACSWLSSTRKSSGGVYGFLSAMMCFDFFVRSTQGMN
jgi:hypothetical protein